MSPRASLRRSLAVARRTARDTGVGAGGAVTLLALSWLLALGRGPGAADRATASSLTLSLRLETTALVVGMAAVVVAAVGVHQDRRSGHFDRLRAGPLGPGEYVLGRWLGGLGVASLVLCAALAVVLLLAAGSRGGGLASSSPLEKVYAARAHVAVADEMTTLTTDRCLLSEESARLVLEFEGEVAEHDCVLHFLLRPVRHEVAEDGPGPRLRVVRGDAGAPQVVADEFVDALLPAVDRTLSVPAGAAPLTVLFKPGAFPAERTGAPLPSASAGIAIALEEVYLEGPAGSLGLAVLRLALGSIAAVAQLLAVAVALSLLMGEVVAILCCGTLLGLGLAHDFLARASAGVGASSAASAHAGHDHGLPFGEGVSQLASVVLAALPDLDRLCGVRAFVARELPSLPPGGLVAVAWTVAALLLARQAAGRRR